MADRPAWRRSLTRFVIRPLETLALHILYFVFRVLPIDAASALGGSAARVLGPRLRLSNRARKNIRRVFPRLDHAAVEGLVREMWDNLGRLAGELPHLPRIKVFDTEPISGKSRVEVVGIEKLNSIIGTGKAVIFFSAHIANWEIGPLMSMRHGLPLNVVYRSANNRVADKLFLAGRRDIVGKMIPKGPDGARQALKLLQDKQPLAMLLDQKMNDGIPVPFFGRDAMTAPAIAQFALRYDCLLVPTWTERLGGAHFRTHVEDPLVVVRTGVRQADIMSIMLAVNARIEDWIRQRPGQWLWLHRRWPD